VLVATFSAETAWAGRKITHDEGHFVLEGFGAIPAAQVLEYDRVTPLVWSTGGTRAWVRSVAFREGGAPARAAVAAPARGAPASDAPSPASQAAAPAGTAKTASPAAQAPECVFARAHYVGGQPSLGGSLDGPLRVAVAAVGMSGGGDDPGLTVATADVAKASLYAARAPVSSGVSASVSEAAQVSGAMEAEDRTFLVVHLRPRGYQAFAIDGMASDAVRAALSPVLAEAGVPLVERGPSVQASPITDQVQRLAGLHANGALTDAEFRAQLGPVFTSAAVGEEEVRHAPGSPGRVSEATREAALDRLSQLRVSGAITDSELAAMRAKLLE
jgi:hypothetical protein